MMEIKNLDPSLMYRSNDLNTASIVIYILIL